MHPLVPYLLGAKHPEGKRLANVQKCIRTGDIDEVGDTTHCTFFEMLGNWSLGDYFKNDAIAWSWEFLTSEKWLNIPKEKIFITVFAGMMMHPATWILTTIGCPMVLTRAISFPVQKHNWWGPAGTTGPCGPIRKCFMIQARRNAALIAALHAAAASMLRSGTMCSWNTIRQQAANMNP